MPIHFDHPEALWLLLLAVPVVALGVRSLATMDRTRRWSAIGLRLVVLTLLVLILSGVQAVRWHEDLTVIAVSDQSESIRRFAQPPRKIPTDQTEGGANQQEPVAIEDWLQDWLRHNSRGHYPDDRLGVITFDGRPIVQSLPSADLDSDTTSPSTPTTGTDIASAIRLGMALFPADSGKRLVLISDGNDTISPDGSDLLAVAREARAAGIPVDVLPIDYRVTNEVLVEGVYAPVESREGQTVSLRVVLRATAPAEGLLHLKHDGHLIDLNGPAIGAGLPVHLDRWADQQPTPAPEEAAPEPLVEAGSTNNNHNDQLTGRTDGGRFVWMRKIEVPLALAGANRFEVVFEPAQGQDTIVTNNKAESFTLVHGKGRLLIVDNLGSPAGRILPNALREHGIESTVVSGRQIPNRLTTLQRYDAVILQNVPIEMVSTKQQKLLARYVNDLGGGLVMVGGVDSFGAGGWTHSPVDQVLPVSCQVPNQTVLPSGALVLVLDRSGSMASGVTGSRYSKQELANESAVLALQTLYPQDMIGVVAFDNSPQWIVQLRMNSSPQRVAKLVRSIQPGGGTNIYPALVEAYEALAPLQAQDAAVKHVILLTDGQSQDGRYYEIVGKMVHSGITVSTVGVGDDVNAAVLGLIAQMSGGTYYPISDPSKLPQVFIKEARTIRKNLVKEVTFDPQVVATGSPIMSGFASVPPLHGFVVTGAKNGAYTPILGPEGEPIFAHWQVGLGRTAAFTSDATNRWSAPWLQWGGYADFWARVVRAVARPSASREFDLLTSFEKDKLKIRLDAVSDAGTKRREAGGSSFVNFLQVAGTVLGPDGRPQPVTLHQTGPGVYEVALPTQEPGNYIVSLFVQGNASGSGDADQRHVVFSGAIKPEGTELRRFRSNRARLEQVAQITGGRVLDPTSRHTQTLFDRGSITASRSIRPLWRPLMFGLLSVFLLDVAIRRIAWDFASVMRWVTQRFEVLGRMMKSREDEAATTLDALKKRANQVDQHLAHVAASGPTADESSTRQAASPSPSPEQKFEAATGAVAEHDLAASLQGAAVTEPQADKPRPRTKASTSQTGSDTPVTGRLLDAKRRARQRMRDDSNGPNANHDPDGIPPPS